MLRFTARRFLYLILVCVLIIFFVHLGMRMSINSSLPAARYSFADQLSLAVLDARAYIGRLVRLDLGTVPQDNTIRSVSEIVGQAYTKSMGLLAISLSAAALIGGIIGIVLAVTRLQRFSLTVLTSTIIGISMPSFFVALLLQRGEIFYLRTTGHQLVKVAGFGWDFEHMLLPVLVLMARPVAYLARSVFMGFERVMAENYIRTAYSKGLAKQRTIYVHAARNIAVPVLTALGVSLRFSLGSLPIVETFFLWPGMGFEILQALNAGQTGLATTLALALGATLLAANLGLDVLYRLIDPRLRGEDATAE
jgi:ABC-type dipeptide/oligopeptide/nickel transport system permease component